MVFDIETSSLPFDSFDEPRQEYLLRGTDSDEEREERKRMMSLNPLTAQVVAIGMAEVRSPGAEPRGGVYSNHGGGDDDPSEEATLEDGTKWMSMSESQMLKRWWDLLARGAKQGGHHLVSFNGRGFDAPFLMLRSMALQIRPTRNLMEGTRWNYPMHTDLQDELAFFNNDRFGAQRRFNFDFYCRAFGITSPKAQGLSGQDVPEYFQNGRHREIAEYCMRDVYATWELFQYWQKYRVGGADW